MSIRLMHASDLHYCQKHLEWVDKAFAFACEDAVAKKSEVAIISGDSFDAAVQLHEPAVDAYFRRIRDLADKMPVCVLQGTFSHDRPGSLTPLRSIGGKYPVLVADRIGQAAWDGNNWIESEGWTFNEIPVNARVVLSLLPSINKAVIAASVGAENAGEQIGEQIYALCRGWSVANLKARGRNVPTVLVTHGTVNGAMTECAHALVSPDHEFTAGTLFAAEASAVCIGHIHAHQDFEKDGRRIAYPGSITHLIYGHMADTGYLSWNVEADRAAFDFIKTPSKTMIVVEFPGTPDMDELARIAAESDGAFVKIKFSVDEEHRHAVDKAAIAKLFEEAAELSIEGRVNPIQRSRSEGMNRATSLTEKLEKWCDVTQSDKPPLVSRLADLEAYDTDEIVAEVFKDEKEKEKAA